MKKLTDEERKIIWEAWQSYDCGMSDPWRNDFQDDGNQADLDRYEYMMNNIREQIPRLSDFEIEKEIDCFR